MTKRLTSRDVAAFLAAKIDKHGKAILPGLGTLRLVERSPRRVVHPATKVVYAVPARPALIFRLAKPRKRA